MVIDSGYPDSSALGVSGLKESMFALRVDMCIRNLLAGLLLALLSSPFTDAQQAKPTNGKDKWAQYEVKGDTAVPAKNAAEKVYTSAARKVVFLIARRATEVYSSASGIILTADGYIATNYHALQGADAVEIRYFPDPEDSETYQSFNGARLLYADAQRDIAILKINARAALPFLACSLKTNCGPHTGQAVYAIGNPKGLNNTISEGIVSALRSADGENLIQHTAPISPGSSGGALLDSTGGLLGMNSWQVADAQNLNFAISAREVLEALAAAKSQTASLSFPPETPAEPVSSPHNSESAASQTSSKDRAVAQMRRIVDALKRCPESTGSRLEPFGAMQRFTAPIVQDWDVIASDSLRSPFQGIVRFRIVAHVEETEAAKHSKKLDAEYRNFALAMKWCEEDNHASCEVTDYRYEFDLGSDPELRRAFMSIAIKKEPFIYQPQDTCWDNIAKSPASAQGDVK
jgi:S1-C subfamily serine protease